MLSFFCIIKLYENQKEKHMKIIQKLVSLTQCIKLKERIIVVYLIGGLLPLVSINLYSKVGMRTILIEQTQESEVAELSLISDAISESMRVIMDISKRMYFDEQIEHIAFTNYENYQEVLRDYRNYTKFAEYLNYNYQEISSITMYLDNPTISNSGQFVYAEEEIKQEDWYQKAVEEDGRPVWTYRYDNMTKKNALRLSRVIRTEDGKGVGVLVIMMQNKRSELAIENRVSETMMLIDDQELIHSNRMDSNVEEMIELLKNCTRTETKQYLEVMYKGEKSVLSFERVKPAYCSSYFTVVSIRPYSEILAGVNENTRTGYVYLLLCVGCSLLFISTFSHRFSMRINTFKEEIHKAANGNFEIAKQIGGRDEIAELYEDLHRMVYSIRELMSTVVEEQVQKEKLYSRQKDVEFKMLASQINPHFLYNTLETIRMKARVNHQAEIEDLVKMLARILRRNIQVGESLVPIQSELEVVEYYLKIQSYRFGDRIKYEIVVECDLENIKVMPLLIQPIVENAFVHGLEAKEGEGVLSIRVGMVENLFIIVKDNGVGIEQERLKEITTLLNDFEHLDKTHIGLSNVNQRIKLLYGEEYGLTLETELGKGTTVLIALPKPE